MDEIRILKIPGLRELYFYEFGVFYYKSHLYILSCYPLHNILGSALPDGVAPVILREAAGMSIKLIGGMNSPFLYLEDIVYFVRIRLRVPLKPVYFH